MRRVGGYAAAGLGLVSVLVAGCWPWLDAAGRRGLVAAAAVAWPVQVGAFGLLLGHRDQHRRFLVAWTGGTAVRLGVIGLAALALTRIPALGAAATLLGLAGFFFGLLLLEPVFLREAGRRGERTDDASRGR